MTTRKDVEEVLAGMKEQDEMRSSLISSDTEIFKVMKKRNRIIIEALQEKLEQMEKSDEE